MVFVLFRFRKSVPLDDGNSEQFTDLLLVWGLKLVLEWIRHSGTSLPEENQELGIIEIYATTEF
jgi:hypothetical protein